MATDRLDPLTSTTSVMTRRRRAQSVSFAPVLTRDLPRTIRHAASLNGHRSINLIITEALTRALDLDLDLDRITPGYGSTR